MEALKLKICHYLSCVHLGVLHKANANSESEHNFGHFVGLQHVTTARMLMRRVGAIGVFTRSVLIILNGKISDKNKIVNLCIDD